MTIAPNTMISTITASHGTDRAPSRERGRPERRHVCAVHRGLRTLPVPGAALYVVDHLLTPPPPCRSMDTSWLHRSPSYASPERLERSPLPRAPVQPPDEASAAVTSRNVSTAAASPSGSWYINP